MVCEKSKKIESDIFGNTSSGRETSRFTAKELDTETGLYYYGARYLNPRTSRWISTDPALESYIPVAPVSEEARRKNQNLPGMGGVFNLINLNLYAYAGNNPTKYVDPTGAFILSTKITGNNFFQQTTPDSTLGNGPTKISTDGCLLTAVTRSVNSWSKYIDEATGGLAPKFTLSPGQLNTDKQKFDGDNLKVAAMIDAFTTNNTSTTFFGGESDFGKIIKDAKDSSTATSLIGKTGTGKNTHFFNIEGIDGNTVEIYDTSTKNREYVDVRDLTGLFVTE